MNRGKGMDYKTRLKQFLRTRLPAQARATLKKRLLKPAGLFFAGNLPELALLYGSDKWGEHWYAQHYQQHFHHLRRKKLTLLEIGIGGYADPKAGGNSLRMWKQYFPKARIVGIDIHDKSSHDEDRIKTFQGDQTDEAFLRRVIDEVGRPDIIIDDGSHINSHIIRTFQILFPLLSVNGIYVVEDTQTSYWPDYGGSSEDLGNTPTAMRMLKSLVDGLNYQEFLVPNYEPSYLDRNVVAVHFYHSLVMIYKGSNDEASNLVRNHTL